MRARREREREGKGEGGKTKSFWWVDNETKCAGGWIDWAWMDVEDACSKECRTPWWKERGGRSKSQGEEEEKVEEGAKVSVGR